MGGVWGGVKSFRSEGSKQWGNLSVSRNRRSNGNAADAKIFVGGSNPGRWTVGASRGGAVFSRPGFEPPTEKTPVSSITIRPLLGLRRKVSPLLGAASATDKKTQTVCFCLTDCWPGLGTDWLTVNLSSRCTAEGNRIYLW